MRTMNEQSENKKTISAKIKGYYFSLEDDVWELGGNYRVRTSTVTDILNENLVEGYLNTLSYFARNHSASYTNALHRIFRRFIKEMKCSHVNKAALLNFRSKIHCNDKALENLKIFINKWHSLGYSGIDSSAIQLIKTRVFDTRRQKVGDVVKRKDPMQGPLTDTELLEFNEGAIRAFEKKEISLLMLTMALLVSHTGRRPHQIMHIKIKDIMMISKKQDNIYYLLNIPRIKHGLGFREEFRTFRITRELYSLVCRQAKESVRLLSEFINREVTKEEYGDVPLFISKRRFNLIEKNANLSDCLKLDVLHYPVGKLTGALKGIVGKEHIISERTKKLLSVNARRFRYTLGTRAAREGYGEIIIAELLDHSDTNNVGVYIENNADNAYRIDEAVGQALAGISGVFKGTVKRKEDIEYDINPGMRIKSHYGEDTGGCQQCSTCDANVPIPCYTCMHFTPWLEGPHEKIYQHLINERERIFSITNDRRVTESLDRTIIAVAQVINQCNIMNNSQKESEPV